MAKDDLVLICKLENIAQKEYLTQLLDNEEIPYHVKSFYDSAYNGLYTATKGFGEIYVLPEYEKKAKEIVQGHE